MTFNVNSWGLLAVIILCGSAIRIVEIIFNDIMVVKSIKKITTMSKKEREKLFEELFGKDDNNESND